MHNHDKLITTTHYNPGTSAFNENDLSEIYYAMNRSAAPNIVATLYASFPLAVQRRPGTMHGRGGRSRGVTATEKR